MLRKLISYDAFEERNSLNRAQRELVEAQDALARTLGVDGLEFYDFNAESVYFETSDGSFIRADYRLDGNDLVLENVEEVVIDEESMAAKQKAVLGQMVDALLEDNTTKADTLFSEVAEMLCERQRRDAARKMDESWNIRRKPHRRNKAYKPGAIVTNTQGSDHRKRAAAAKKGHQGHKQNYLSGAQRASATKRSHSSEHRLLGKTAARLRRIHGVGKKKMTEWAGMSENVLEFVDHNYNGHVIAEAKVQTNDKGDVTAVRLPVTQARNEGKVLQAKWKTLKTDVKVLREAARTLVRDHQFAQALAELKRNSNLAVNDALEETVGSIVSKWSQVMYLTQDELSKMIGECLSSVNVKNYDTKTCQFMAEGILRTALHAFGDRAERIVQLASANLTAEGDRYVEFQGVVKNFYAHLDESMALEMKVFEDLYNAAVDVRRVALEVKDDTLREEAAGFAADLERVMEGEAEPTLELAADVARWLSDLVETNLDMKDWDVVKTPHDTENGDHPAMFQKAKHSYTPSSDFTGDWGDEAPVSDGKTYRKSSDDVRHKSWANKNGSETNPYVPKPFGDYTMKGEPGVDKNQDSGLAQWQDGEVGDKVHNPYCPKSVKPKVNSDNRVDD